jgi:hypothetical protein
LSSAGELHRMEAGHAGSNASAPIRGDQLTRGKYAECNLPKCFGKAAADVPGAETPTADSADSGSAEGTSSKKAKTPA